MLSDRDRELVESLPFDPNATAAFNAITACLVWSDELPSGLTPYGYDFMRDLLVARGYLHRGVPPEAWDSPERLERWNEALAAELRWNGFRRVTLTGPQRALLYAHLADPSPP